MALLTSLRYFAGICAVSALAIGCGEEPRTGDAAPRMEVSTGTPARDGPPAHAEVVEGVFAGWERGDYLWARIEAEGREPISARPGDTPIEYFLHAHRGRRLAVEIATSRTYVPEAGGAVEVARITAARAGALSARDWWQRLAEDERERVRRSFEEEALAGG